MIQKDQENDSEGINSDSEKICEILILSVARMWAISG
jgi:hypothetical protein